MALVGCVGVCRDGAPLAGLVALGKYREKGVCGELYVYKG